MIPVHGSKQDVAPDLAGLVVTELDAVERGLKILARAVPLEDAVVLDALAIDIDRRAVLVLVENGFEDLHVRAADAVLAYRRSRALLARLLASDSLDETADPRLLLVSRRFSDREEARCRLLPGGGTTLVEVAVVEGATGRQILLLARGGDQGGQLGKRPHGLRLIGGEIVEPVPAIAIGDGAAVAVNFTVQEAVESKAAPTTDGARANGARRGSETSESDGVGRALDSRAAPQANGHAASERLNYFDELKRRIVRMSPDVLEEQDGDLVCFRLGSRRLAALSRGEGNTAQVCVEDGVDATLVQDSTSMTATLDSLFERFFNLVATRNSSASPHSSRLTETAASKRPVRESAVAAERTRVAARADS